MNNRDLTQLVKHIEELSKDQHIQILSIFKKYNVEITENSNGCFIDMTELQPVVFEELKKYTDYVQSKKDDMHTFEAEKEDLKKKIKTSAV
jgi:hypothetical protein